MSKNIQNLTKSSFSNVIKDQDTPVLVDFWAPWCGPCRMQSPILEEVANEVGEKATISKVNVDDEPEIANQFDVMSIPTLVVFKDGKPVKKLVGLQDKKTLIQALAS